MCSAVGGQTYQIIMNLFAPTKQTEVTFAKIAAAVQKHVQPRPSIIIQRFNFHSGGRRRGENISTYVAELRKLSEHCNFGTTLNDMLRNRLVCGVGDQRIQRRLLAEPDLTFRFPAVLTLTLLEAAFVGLVFTTSTTIAASPTLSMGVFPRTCKFIILLDEAAYLLPAPECFPLPPRLPCQFEGFGEHLQKVCRSRL